jgi:GT2 family glycosyltransferase
MEQRTDLVSIVLLACNGERYIQECARSIAAQSYHNLEIIVIDNGSTDGSIQRLKRSFPGWSYIEHGKNLGFAAGMDSGLKMARGAYVVPLNQDVYLDKDFISKCVEIMKSLPQAGALGAMEYKWVEGKLTNELRALGPALFLRLRFQGLWLKIGNSLVETFGVNGSFPFLRRQALTEIEQIDGHIYDPAFFSGWEDLDLWWRMQLRGWQCYATPAAKAWHVGSSFAEEKQTFISKPPHYQSWVMRNRWFVILKNLPGPLLLMLSPVLLACEVGLPFYLLLRSPRTLGAWIGSWQEIARSFPNIRLKRGLIQRSRRIPLKPVIRWFKGI